MGGYGADFSYLHQGLDIITPINEPTYAVQGGVVKCVLTLGGNSYWRLAISPEQSPYTSSGWLYAHLVQGSIQFGVGDTVSVYDYIGDIIQWSQDWGHIHFVEISDSGTVWLYSDNQWGINFNPLLALTPATDSNAPYFENVFENSKFGYCINEADSYLNPDSLFGSIDIIAKIVDYMGDSEWQQPAYETYYWVESVMTDSIVYPRTMGHILNHPYEFYESNQYEPYATLIYKRDQTLQPSIWMDTLRNYHHVLTNSNGDSVGELWEKTLGFNTADYPDGPYRVFIEAIDEAGNSSIDSQDVIFRNGITGINEPPSQFPSKIIIDGVYPNPFNSDAILKFELFDRGNVTLGIYDVLGRLIFREESYQLPGKGEFVFNGSDLISGIYFYKIDFKNISIKGSMTLIK
jgi:hypothetical protein